MKIRAERIRHLNDRPVSSSGQYVLYWMQQSQRHVDNHALEYAIGEANFIGCPVLVVFVLAAGYPDANIRHYSFMLEGLRICFRELRRRGLSVCLRLGNPPEIAAALTSKAALAVCDCGYLRHQREWRSGFANAAFCRVVQVESDAVVPVETASDKMEYAARTIRPKLMSRYRYFIDDDKQVSVENPGGVMIAGEDCDNVQALLDRLGLDDFPSSTEIFPSGPVAAKAVFRTFLNERLNRYVANRNQPQTDDVSHMSKYLHFGQVSPSWLIREIDGFREHAESAVDAFVEELLVRRELALNFTNYNDGYDRFDGLPGWALATLDAHRNDRRPFVYTHEELENALTHDVYWNAAMNEMRSTGYMHNYMRMYWGKKILEWSPTPEQAFRTALILNNRYFIDGRDPNSYAGVAWLFGRHDRPWGERQVFGTVRCMTAAGLERKCDIHGYVKKVASLTTPLVCKSSCVAGSIDQISD